MLSVGYHRMRNAGVFALALSALELTDIFAFDGDLGTANPVASVGEGLVRAFVETCPESVCVRVAGLSAELAGGISRSARMSAWR